MERHEKTKTCSEEKGRVVLPDIPLAPRNTLFMGPQVPRTNGTSGPRDTGLANRDSKEKTLGIKIRS